jgi:hypothetical protein
MPLSLKAGWRASTTFAMVPLIFGATLAVEATPIEEWLELEFGVTALVTSDRREARLTGSKRFRASCSGAAISLNGGLLFGWH